VLVSRSAAHLIGFDQGRLIRHRIDPIDSVRQKHHGQQTLDRRLLQGLLTNRGSARVTREPVELEMVRLRSAIGTFPESYETVQKLAGLLASNPVTPDTLDGAKKYPPLVTQTCALA
jgi:hypothetical protein